MYKKFLAVAIICAIMVGMFPVPIAAVSPPAPLHLIDFSDARMAAYDAYLHAGAQVSMERVAGFARSGSHSMRLTNTTGNFTSGEGNFLRFDLPQPFTYGGEYEVSWWVYIPEDRNPDKTTIPGGGLVLNSVFGSADHQPTNATDLNSTTPMGEWVQFTTNFRVDDNTGDVEHLIFRFRVNEPYRVPSVWYIDGITVNFLGVPEVLNWDLSLPSIYEAFAGRFLFGNIWSSTAQMGDVATHNMFLHHYNSVTASNHHKVSFLLGNEANEWNWNFAQADAIVDWAEENDLAMVFHTLLWHTQSRPWLTNVPGTTEPLTRAEAIENMHRYISTVASRYSGRIRSWDVVNEAIVPQGSWCGDWRNHARRAGVGVYLDRADHSQWYDAFANGADVDAGECGTDYIFYAFRFARIYDPFAVLYYNDYNEFQATKRDAIANMVEEINERWRDDPLYDGRLLIEGIGMQAHYDLRNWPSNVGQVRQALERFVATGAVVSITELNVYLNNGGINPTPENLPTLFVEQATRYRQLFHLFSEFSDYIERVTMFIWVDLPAQEGAWRRWPHSQHPALFDLDRQAKPAFFAVLEAVETATPNELIAPGISQNLRSGLVAGQNNHFAAQMLAVQNGHAPVLWSVAEGALPPGLELIATTGVVKGTPTANGEFTFTAAAENVAGRGTREFTFLVQNGVATITAAEYPPEPPAPLPPQRRPLVVADEVIGRPGEPVQIPNDTMREQPSDEADSDDDSDVDDADDADNTDEDSQDNVGIVIAVVLGIAVVVAGAAFLVIRSRSK